MYSLFINLLDAVIVLALEEEEGEEIVVLPYSLYSQKGRGTIGGEKETMGLGVKLKHFCQTPLQLANPTQLQLV